MNREEVLTELIRAESVEDPAALEEAICAAFEVGLFREVVPVFVRLLGQSWHTRHEDLALGLQELKDPRSVAALEASANQSHDYLDFDEFFALARKCTWALADIGTVEARAALGRLANNSNQVIASYAQRRIDRWNREISRKGA